MGKAYMRDGANTPDVTTIIVTIFAFALIVTMLSFMKSCYGIAKKENAAVKIEANKAVKALIDDGVDPMDARCAFENSMACRSYIVNKQINERKAAKRAKEE